MWARRWTRTDAYVLRKCVPAKPRATFTFLSALAPGEAESTGSSVASAFSALVALAGPQGSAKPIGNGRLTAVGEGPADASVDAVGCPSVCPCEEAVA